MIKQEAIGLNSRQEANIYDENGMLPLMTAPMFSVVNETNYQIFLNNKIQVCLPRKCKTDTLLYTSYPLWLTYCLEDFSNVFLQKEPLTFKHKVCIDTANGNMPALHEAIRKAREIHGNNLIIMAGNVASEDAFVELAKTGVDYIRVGIGGGGGCNTTSNTGVGQIDLRQLIRNCNDIRKDLYGKHFHSITKFLSEKERCALQNCKIVADGISSYIKQCEEKYGFNDNGYAAINTLIYAGADIVMVGKLFAQCLESAGEKAIGSIAQPGNLHVSDIDSIRRQYEMYNDFERCYVKYSGMSTLQEQEKYKDGKWGVYKNSRVPDTKHPYKDQVFDTEQEAKNYAVELSAGNPVGFTAFPLGKKPSEGSVQWIPVRFFLREWLHGNDTQDNYPYLMGFVNSLKSAMSYTGNKTI